MASNDWKKKNYNTSVKVSESTIQQLRAGKTFEGNIAKFKSGATAEQREAMNRFYGKARVDSALGSAVSTVNKTYPGTTRGGTPGAVSGKAPSAYKTTGLTKTSAPKSGGGNVVGNFVKNELLGVDDFSSMVSHLKKREFKAAAKSAATGAFEAGSTAAAIGASAFTGGAAGTAYVAAKVGARQVGKQVIKQSGKHAAKAGVKTVASKAGLGAAKGAAKVVKTAATGSIKTGAKNTIKAPITAARAVKSGTGAARKAYTGAKNISPSMVGEFIPAAQKARAATSATKGATKAYRGVKSSAKSTGNLKSNVKGLGAAYDAMSSAKGASKAARGELNAIRKEMAKKAAKGKTVRKITRRVQAVQVGRSGVAYYNRRGNQ